MSSATAPSVFRITEHEIESSYVREYPRSTASTSVDSLHLHVKHYEPLDNLTPRPGDVTIITAPGVGFVKELYEPLFESITANASQHGFRIRGFWIADPVGAGESARLNENELGNDPNWFDHARDLFCTVNHFRKEMPRPLVGLGHSFGAAQMVFLANMHPRLFHTMLLVEPAIHMGVDPKMILKQARGMMKRRDGWSSRSDVEAWIQKNPYYKNWDPRTISRFVEYGFIEDEQPADGGAAKLRSKTPPMIEVTYLYRPNLGAAGSQGPENITAGKKAEVPDIHPNAKLRTPVYRPEGPIAFNMLPSVRPSVQFVLGESSGYAAPEIQNPRFELTGTGVGGSGGQRLGRVRQHFVKGGMHTIPVDKNLDEVASVAAQWIGQEHSRWVEMEETAQRDWDIAPRSVKTQVDAKMAGAIKEWNGGNWIGSDAQKKLIPKL